MTTTVLPRSTRAWSTARSLSNVVEVETGGRLVEQIEGLSGGAFGELARQLDPLRLTTGEGGCRLAEVEIVETDGDQRVEDTDDLRAPSRRSRAPD